MHRIRRFYKKNTFLFWEVIVFFIGIAISIVGICLFQFAVNVQFGQTLGIIGCYVLLLAPIIFAIDIITGFYKIIKNGYENLHNYCGIDDYMFVSIDKYKNMGEIQSCTLCIKQINEIYNSKIINKYIEEKDLTFFYSRKYYLEKHSNIHHDLVEVLRSILISFSSIFFSSLMNIDSTTIDMIINIIFLGVLILFVVVIPYAKKIFGEHELREVDLYEIDMINVCIEQIYNRLLIEKEFSFVEKAYETKCSLYDDAKKVRIKKRSRKKIIRWDLFPRELWGKEKYKILQATLMEEDIIISFIVKESCYSQYIYEKGNITRQELKECLISEDYKNCFEYIEKYFENVISFTDKEIQW